MEHRIGIVVVVSMGLIMSLASAVQAQGPPLTPSLKDRVELLEGLVEEMRATLEAVDAGLASRVTALEEGLDAEIAARTGGDDGLQSQIDALQSGLTGEIAARSGADDALQGQMTSVQSQLSSLQGDVVTQSEIIDLIDENALSIQPDYDSGWFELEAGDSVVLQHNLALYSAQEQVLVFLLARDEDGWQFQDSYWTMTEAQGDQWHIWEFGANWTRLMNDYIEVINHRYNCNGPAPTPITCIVSEGAVRFHSFRVLIWKVYTPGP